MKKRDNGYIINHIGYLTSSINQSTQILDILGYKIRGGGGIDDDRQRVRVCFLEHRSNITIELVEPYADNKTMQRMLSKQGPGIYHVCYEVDDIMREFEYLTSNDWIPLFEPVEAPAFGNRKICYFWKRELGFIEIVNK